MDIHFFRRGREDTKNKTRFASSWLGTRYIHCSGLGSIKEAGAPAQTTISHNATQMALHNKTQCVGITTKTQSGEEKEKEKKQHFVLIYVKQIFIRQNQ